MATPCFRTGTSGVVQVTVVEVGIFSQRDGDVLLSCDAAPEACSSPDEEDSPDATPSFGLKVPPVRLATLILGLMWGVGFSPAWVGLAARVDDELLPVDDDFLPVTSAGPPLISSWEKGQTREGRGSTISCRADRRIARVIIGFDAAASTFVTLESLLNSLAEAECPIVFVESLLDFLSEVECPNFGSRPGRYPNRDFFILSVGLALTPFSGPGCSANVDSNSESRIIVSSSFWKMLSLDWRLRLFGPDLADFVFVSVVLMKSFRCSEGIFQP
jgi:hypothetical protein